MGAVKIPAHIFISEQEFLPAYERAANGYLPFRARAAHGAWKESFDF